MAMLASRKLTIAVLAAFFSLVSVISPAEERAGIVTPPTTGYR
jgi:hypothetical protein